MTGSSGPRRHDPFADSGEMVDGLAIPRADVGDVGGNGFRLRLGSLRRVHLVATVAQLRSARPAKRRLNGTWSGPTTAPS